MTTFKDYDLFGNDGADERKATQCVAGQRTAPRDCDRHSAHHWCGTCVGFYGVPHTGIHEGHTAHPFGTSLTDQCACRPCKQASGREPVESAEDD